MARAAGLGWTRQGLYLRGEIMAAARKTTIVNEVPLDYTRLRKGTWIEADELERATRPPTKRTDVMYLRRVLDLRDKIERKTGILSRIDGLRLRLMTDSEALPWNIRQAKLASERLELAAVRQHCRIDRNGLTEPEQRMHEHASRVIIAMADAQYREKKKAARLFEFIHTPKQLASGDEGE
jgi:hypothetical protein